jgi:uncharacterized protein
MLLIFIMDYLIAPWPWYVSGALIAIVMNLIVFSGKRFGISSTMRACCTILGAGKLYDFFKFDWKSEQGWNLVFIAGALIGGFIAANFLNNPDAIEIGARTSEHISNVLELDKPEAGSILPAQFSESSFIFSWKGLIMFVFGGFLVGFGTRYAGGCTSGHAISGLSELQLPSLLAVIGFFIGGLLMTHIIMPLIF